MLSYRILYTFQNACKNLLRTRELAFPLVILFLTGTLTYLAGYLLFFFHTWKTKVVVEKNFIALLPITIFQAIVAILFFGLVIFLLLNTKNSFRSFFFMQRSDSLTMSYLGESSFSISSQFALQPVFCLIVLLPISAKIGKVVAQHFVTDFMSGLALSLTIPHELRWLSISILFCCIFIFFSIFFSINRFISR